MGEFSFSLLLLQATTKLSKEESSKKSDPPSKNDKEQEKPVSNGIKAQGFPEPVGPGFTPVYLANSSQPCQCSACVGAMAANITKVVHDPVSIVCLVPIIYAYLYSIYNNVHACILITRASLTSFLLPLSLSVCRRTLDL